MLAALTLAIALGALGPDPKLRQLSVGPIHLGERISDVQKTLGPGWRGPVYDEGMRSYVNALVYTDGVDQLDIYIVPTTDLGDIAWFIVARQNRAQGAPLRFHTALRDWHWDLGTLFDTPSATRSWTGGPDRTPRSGDNAVATYDYGHPLSVWFTRNKWGGLDFHMFEE